MTAAEKKDHLVKDSLILFVASSVVNASNFIFHMYAARNLKPEEYGKIGRAHV
jgi:O-antigen/teichoic acid export membrane protein